MNVTVEAPKTLNSSDGPMQLRGARHRDGLVMVELLEDGEHRGDGRWLALTRAELLAFAKAVDAL